MRQSGNYFLKLIGRANKLTKKNNDLVQLITGGYSFAYNCDLYYRKYFPDYNLSWWLFLAVTVIGSIGVVAGGVISDKFVAKMGVKSRVFILGLSQIIAAPFSFGAIHFGPTLAMISLCISYFFGN